MVVFGTSTHPFDYLKTGSYSYAMLRAEGSTDHEINFDFTNSYTIVSIVIEGCKTGTCYNKGFDRYWKVGIYNYVSSTGVESLIGWCWDGAVLDANGSGLSHFHVTCNDETGFTGNRVKLVKQCSVISCTDSGNKSMISGMAILVSNDIITASCTPDD